MKKIIVALALLLAFTMPVATQEAFFAKQAGPWDIEGVPSHGPKNAACGAKYQFGDGSTFVLYSDLIDGELYAIVYNVAWNLQPNPQNAPSTVLRMNFHAKGKFVEGKMANYLALDKGTIAIPNILFQVFLPPFTEHDRLELVMPGDIPNAVIPLVGSMEAVKTLIECVKAGGKQAPPKKQSDAKL
jgi:hypothetical protein